MGSKWKRNRISQHKKAGFRVIWILLLGVILVISCGIGVQLHDEVKKESVPERQYQVLRQEKERVTEKKKEKKGGMVALKERYPHMIAWIEIPQTDFSYPVMQTEDDPNYFLHRDVHGRYSFYGTPFLDYRCTLESDHLIIYGHNINGRRFFGYLQNFKEEEFYHEHKDLTFTGGSGKTETFGILAVIKTNAYSDFYEHTDIYNAGEYKAFVEKILENSEYDTDMREMVEKEMKENTVEAFFHRFQFVSLSTCRTTEGRTARLLVIACRRRG